MQEDQPWKCLAVELDIDGLTQSALTSFAIIEPWCQARRSSNHPLVIALVKNIVEQAKEYVIAIEMSVETARNGYSFADHAVALCDFMRAEHVPVKHLERFLEDMLKTANLAHDDALAMNKQFKQVRSAFFQVCSTSLSSTAIVLLPYKQITRNISLDVNAIQQEKLDISPAAWHVVSMPVSLTLRDITARIQGRGRRVQQHSIAEVLTQLEQANNDLSNVIESIGHLVEWWGSMKITLGTLRTTTSLITCDGSNPLQEIFVRTKWERARSNYLQYQNSISLIRDYYSEFSLDDPLSTLSPPPIPRANSGSFSPTHLVDLVSEMGSPSEIPSVHAGSTKGKSKRGERRRLRQRFRGLVDQLVSHGSDRPR